jgi:HemK-related putative methylase
VPAHTRFSAVAPQRTGFDPHGLAVALRNAGYTAEAVQRLLAIAYPDDIGPLNRVPAVRRLAEDRSTAAALVRLFFLEADEPERSVARALPRGRSHELITAGLLQRVGKNLRARLRLDPIGDQYLLADRRFRSMDARALRLPGRDPVYPPSSDSLMLRDAVVTRTPTRVLDLCTGSGVQALRHAPHAGCVIAVDLNPRAVALAQINARLNGLDTVDVRGGDLYDPVHGERFDLIIANPPFVTSPYASGPAYHSGGATGDAILRRVIAGFRAHLAPDGRAFAITHLGLRTGETIESVAGCWFRHFPGRALVLVIEKGTAIDLAAAQALFAIEHGLAAYAREVGKWIAFLRRHRISTIVALLIAAERGERTAVEVVDARPRVLPIPLTRAPAERIQAWCAAP